MIESVLKKISDDVHVALDGIVRFDQRAIEFVKEKALSSSRGRARICMHKNNQHSLHEMLIAMRSDTYVRPHRHHNKSESFHLIEGRADVLILTELGDVLDVIELGKDKNFYYRLDESHYHTLIIHSPIFVVHEITDGPFIAEASDFAPFAPADENEGREFISNLKGKR